MRQASTVLLVLVCASCSDKSPSPLPASGESDDVFAVIESVRQAGEAKGDLAALDVLEASGLTERPDLEWHFLIGLATDLIDLHCPRTSQEVLRVAEGRVPPQSANAIAFGKLQEHVDGLVHEELLEKWRTGSVVSEPRFNDFLSTPPELPEKPSIRIDK